MYSASATPGRFLISSRKASPSLALASRFRYREICAARCQEPPRRSTLLSSSDRPIGRLKATAITMQVKKLPTGCLARRRRLSSRLARWFSTQARSSVAKSGPSSSSCFFFFGCGSAGFGATRSETLGLRVALIRRPPRHRSGDRVAGSACDGAGDADALLLAGGQVARIEVGLVRQRHALQGRVHAFDDFGLGQPKDLQRQRDVIEHRAIEQQLVVLEHHADLAAQERNLRIADGGQVLARQQQFAGARAFHGQQQAQQSTFTGARMAGDKQEFAATHSKAQLMQADMPVGIAFTDLFESNHERSRSANSAWTKGSASNVRRSSIPSPTPM